MALLAFLIGVILGALLVGVYLNLREVETHSPGLKRGEQIRLAIKQLRNKLF